MKLSEFKAKIDEMVARGLGDCDIIASTDAEGNGYSQVDELSVEKCYEGEPVHPDDIEDGEYDTADISEKIVLWVC